LCKFSTGDGQDRERSTILVFPDFKAQFVETLKEMAKSI
jgi:hypothetical protein